MFDFSDMVDYIIHEKEKIETRPLVEPINIRYDARFNIRVPEG